MPYIVQQPQGSLVKNDRYARHHLIDGWQQEKLRNAQVIIIGMGALGNEVARLLALSGVGELILCDPDTISVSNLSRCGLFCETDVGKYKVDVAAKNLPKLQPTIEVKTRRLALINAIGLGELRDASLVVGCLDSRSARLQISGRCQLVQTAYIDGGTHPWGGEIHPCLTPKDACYACHLSHQQRAIVDAPWSCMDHQHENSPNPATAASTALIGSWMVLLATRFIMRLPISSEIISVDAESHKARWIKQFQDENCLLHHPIENIKILEITNQETLAELYELLPKKSEVLIWSAIQYRESCLSCSYDNYEWRQPEAKTCPQCQHVLRIHTKLALDKTANHLTLEKLGIAPKEILAVRHNSALIWVELQ